MKALLLFVLSLNLFALEDREVLLDSISQYAIRIGEGPNRVYAFVDPLCPFSQAFISLIDNREDLQKKSSYYIFLYRLPKFDSDKLIEYIYQSSHPLSTLQEVMIYKDYETEDDFKATPETRTIVRKVAEVARKMEIKSRPYLLFFDEGSEYCRVSEGTAPCLEENALE